LDIDLYTTIKLYVNSTCQTCLLLSMQGSVMVAIKHFLSLKSFKLYTSHMF